MAEFRIPKGKPYQFTVRVVAKDSFLAQDLTDLAVNGATFELMAIATMSTYTTVAEADGLIIGVVQGNPLDGIVKFSVDSTYTDGLKVTRGEAVDGYYLKPGYQGIITLAFTDSLVENRVSTIDNVYVVPTGNV
jgi:hypothetical protein